MCSCLGEAPPKSAHPVDVGQRTEAIVQAELVKQGFTVLTPFGVNHRYDLVVETPTGFVRAQCKTGRLRDGVILFATTSTQANTRRVISRGYKGEADVFLVYCAETDAVYAIPVAEAAATSGSLRLTPSKNGQQAKVRRAEDYVLA